MATRVAHGRALVGQIGLKGGAVLFDGAGAPVDGTSGTGAGFAGPGSLYVDVSAKKLYQNTNTKASPTWQSVGEIILGEITLAEGSIIVGNASGVGAALAAKTSGQILVGDGTTLASVAVSGDATLSSAGALTIVQAESIAKTITSATPATERLVRSELTLTPTTVMSVAGGGSLVAVRGGVTVTTGKSFVDGFAYGAQGKVTLNGTLAQSSAGRLAGALGQVDLASGTLTSGQVSAVWGDLQSTAPTLTDHSELNVARLTNSMASQAKCNAFVYSHGMADYWADINEPAESIITTGAATPSSTMKKIKVKVGGTDLYLLAAAVWS